MVKSHPCCRMTRDSPLVPCDVEQAICGVCSMKHPCGDKKIRMCPEWNKKSSQMTFWRWDHQSKKHHLEWTELHFPAYLTSLLNLNDLTKGFPYPVCDFNFLKLTSAYKEVLIHTMFYSWGVENSILILVWCSGRTLRCDT